MPDTFTTNYNWTKPEVGGSNGSWGSKLNTQALDGIDSQMKIVEDKADAAQATADAALPKAGGVMTGPVETRAIEHTRVEHLAATGALALNMTNGQVFDVTPAGATTFSITNVPGPSTWVVIRLDNSAAQVITWPASVIWPDDVEPDLDGISLIALVTFDSGTTWYGNYVLGYSA